MTKIHPKFRGKIERGKLTLHDEKEFREYLHTMNGEVDLTVKPYKKTRTTGAGVEKSNQNGYYWAVVIPILAEHKGYAPDEMHRAIGFKFLRIGGTESLPKIRSTGDLNTAEWEDLMSQIRIWAQTDENVYIPQPNETEGRWSE